MKLLLTSGGIRNASLHAALVRMLGKPIGECHALLVPTAHYGHPQGTPAGAWRFVNGRSGCPMGELGWKSLGLAALLPSLERLVWVGLSAGSMVMTPRVGPEFVESRPSITGSDATLGAGQRTWKSRPMPSTTRPASR